MAEARVNEHDYEVYTLNVDMSNLELFHALDYTSDFDCSGHFVETHNPQMRWHIAVTVVPGSSASSIPGQSVRSSTSTSPAGDDVNDDVDAAKMFANRIGRDCAAICSRQARRDEEMAAQQGHRTL